MSYIIGLYLLGVAVTAACMLVSWYRECPRRFEVLEIIAAVLCGTGWPIVLPFWVWYKIDTIRWERYLREQQKEHENETH